MRQRKYIEWGSSGNSIRRIAAYADKRAKEVGSENVYDFSIGSPSVAPPKELLDELKRQLEEDDPTLLHAYTPAAGFEAVRQKIAEDLNKRFKTDYDFEDIYITAGSSAALAASCASLLEEGDEAIVIAPFFSEYEVFIRQAGAEMVVVRCKPEDFEIDTDDLAEKITEKTRVVMINSPNNPSGAIYTHETVTAAAKILTEKSAQYGHPIYIVADEPYRDLAYGGIYVPFLPNYYKNTLFCYSYSKSLSLPGERIGFLAIPKACDDYTDVRAGFYGATRALGYLCVSPMFQLAAAKTLGAITDISVYDVNRTLIYEKLTELGFDCVRPEGAFYLFIKSPISDSRKFCDEAMAKDIMLVPGDDFGCPGYARLAYCVPKERIERSFDAFAALAQVYNLTK